MANPDARDVLRKGESAYAKGEFDAARELFEQAAASGVTEALYYLGLIYKDGDGVVADFETAKTLLQRFLRALREEANSGNAASQLRLGKMFQYGDQVLIDEREAYKWISTAAQSGHPPAQFHLSCIYGYGWCGVSQNDVQQELWLNKAADAGFPEAMYQRGIGFANLYFESGDLQARQSAIAWLERAGRAGYEDANAVLQSVLEENNIS